MEPEDEKRLREGLLKLHKEVTLQKETKTDSNEIQQHIDAFDMTWADRINDAERYELRGSRVGIREAVGEMERQAQQQRDARDSALLPQMDAEAQVHFWNSSRNGDAPARQQPEQTRLSDAAFDLARTAIQERYSNLRDGMQQAVQDIMNSKEPSLSFLIAQQMTKEQDMAEKAQPNKEIVKAALAQLKTIEAKKREANKDMER